MHVTLVPNFVDSPLQRQILTSKLSRSYVREAEIDDILTTTSVDLEDISSPVNMMMVFLPFHQQEGIRARLLATICAFFHLLPLTKLDYDQQ